MRPIVPTHFDRELAQVALERREQTDFTSPRDTAMDRAVAAVESGARRSIRIAIKSRVLAYLNPPTRWELDMLWQGLSSMCPEEGLKILARARSLPSYQHRVSLINIRAAQIVFRLERRKLRVSEGV